MQTPAAADHRVTPKTPGTIRALLVCTGVGTLNRGIETFARECFDGLKNLPGLDLTLLKGRGEEKPGETTIWNFPRTTRAARISGLILRRSPYTAEQLSSLVPVIWEIRRRQPQVIFSSEANLFYQLHRWRSSTGVPYRLLFSNGAPLGPPYDRTDYVHQVNPVFYQEAIDSGEPPRHQLMVPYGIHTPAKPAPFNPDDQRQFRSRLGLPAGRPVILSVGHIGNSHKRMDYLIDELAALPEPRPFLAMIGAMDETSPPYVRRAHDALGGQGFLARSVPYQAVADYYKAADVFALASLTEGFGRVYLEALMHGLPVIAHDHPVMRYVIGPHGRLVDMSRPGSLSSAIAEELAEPVNDRLRRARWERVREQFDWETLAPQYLEMFRQAASGPIRSSAREGK